MKERQTQLQWGLVGTISFAIIVLIAVTWRRRRWQRISIFLSYRVATDQQLVGDLFKRLLEFKLSVWWDVKCLKKGQLWEDGFADGLFRSAVFVPVLSKGALANFAKLDADSACDNVLLEHVLALEQHARSKVKAIFPVFVGEVEPGSSLMTNFFASGGLPQCSKDATAVAAVDKKAVEHLDRRYGKNLARGALMVQKRAPCEVLAALCRHQGGFIEHDRDESLDKLAANIREMVMDVANGKVIAEAKELEEGACAPPRELRLPRRRAGCIAWLLSDDRAKEDDTASLLRRTNGGVSQRGTVSTAHFAACSPTAGTSGDISQFFSPALMGDAESSALNPILLHQAKEADRAAAERAVVLRRAASHKSGALRRLLPREAAKSEVPLSPDAALEHYLKEEVGVLNARAAVEQRLPRTSRAAMKLDDDVRERARHDVVAHERRKLWRPSLATAAVLDNKSRVVDSTVGARPPRPSVRLVDVAAGRVGSGDAFTSAADVSTKLASAIKRVSTKLASAKLASAKRRSTIGQSGGELGSASVAASEETDSVREESNKQETEETKESAAEAQALPATRLTETWKALEQESARVAAAEATAAAERISAQIRIDVNAIGFMALKKILLVRGMPQELVASCISKVALRDAARTWQGELYIDWVEAASV